LVSVGHLWQEMPLWAICAMCRSLSVQVRVRERQFAKNRELNK